MKERMIEASCPFCGHTFYIKRDTLVISSMNPVIVSRLKDRTYFSHLCSKCHHLFYLTYPFMLKNTEKKYCLIVSDRENFEDLVDQGRVVVVKSVNAFYQAFAILEANLSFPVVLKKQKQLEARVQQSVLFESYDSKNQCLWFEVGSQLLAVLLSDEEVEKIQLD